MGHLLEKWWAEKILVFVNSKGQLAALMVLLKGTHIVTNSFPLHFLEGGVWTD